MSQQHQKQQPSYKPSIPIPRFQLCKSEYYVGTPTIPSVQTFLKPRSDRELLEVAINIGDKSMVTVDEWKRKIILRASDITNFFRYDSTPLQISTTYENGQSLVTFVNSSTTAIKCEEKRKKFIVFHFDSSPLCVYSEEWWFLDNLLNLINVNIDALEKIKEFYVKRMNFFKNRFKIFQVKSLLEAYKHVKNSYDETSVIDGEIKGYAIEYLFYLSLLEK